MADTKPLPSWADQVPFEPLYLGKEKDQAGLKLIHGEQAAAEWMAQSDPAKPHAPRMVFGPVYTENLQAWLVETVPAQHSLVEAR